MPITPFYAALLAGLFVYLAIRVIGFRRQFKIGTGDGDNPVLRKAIRAHANFAEYVPLALLLVYFLEALAAPAWFIHGLLLTLVAGRLFHAYGISQVDEDFRGRVRGMGMTFGVIGTAATGILIAYLARAFT